MSPSPGTRASTEGLETIGRAQAPGPPTALVRRIRATALAGTGADPAFAPGSGPARTPRPPAETWQDALEDTLRDQPLRARSAVLTVREAVGAATPRTPIVACRSRVGAPDAWWALLDRSAGRALVASADGPDEWLSPRALAERLGAGGPDEVAAWVVVEGTLGGVAGGPTEGRRPGQKRPPMSRLFELARPDRADVWTVVLYAIVIGALTLATPIAVQQLVNTVAFGGLVQPVVILALLLFGGLAFSALLSALQTYVAEQLQRRIFVRITMDVAERLPRVRIDAFDRVHGPELVNRIFDVFTVQKEGAALLLDGTTVVLQTVVGLLVLSLYHPLILGFSIVLLAAIAFVVTVLGRGAVPTAIGESNAKYAVASWLEELARHPVAFHNAGGRAFAIERADGLASHYVSQRHRHFRIVLRQISGALGLQVLASSAILGLGGTLVVGGQLTLGQLVASELIVTAIVAAVAKLGKHLESLYDLLAGVDKLGMLLDLPLEEDTGTTTPRHDAPAALALHDVRFGFGGRPVLDRVSFRVESGERVALVGPGGSGKSLTLDLVQRLRQPESGFLTFDDVDLRLYRLDALRDQVARAGETEVFSGSVLDNVRLLRPTVSAADVDAALERLGLAETVRALPQGLDTPLSTHGWPLSPAQVTILMLARAIVTRPRLLLLDEAFTGVEEPLRSRALDGVFDPDAPWTVVVVTDREDVLARCDRVVDLTRRGDGAGAGNAEPGR